MSTEPCSIGNSDTIAQLVQRAITETQEWGDDGEDYDEELDGGLEEEDADAEAEEIARRLGDQLWAEISKAQLEVAATTTTTATTIPSTFLPPLSSAPSRLYSPAPIVDFPDTRNDASTCKLPQKKLEEAIMTMKSVLAYASKDPLASSTLGEAIVPDSNGANVLEVLSRIIASGTVSKEVAKKLSHLLVSLARSEILFSSLRHSNASSIQLEQGKRKRDEHDSLDLDIPASKRPMYAQTTYDLHTQIQEASRVISHALQSTPSRDKPLEPSVIYSIQFQLHQIFLFAVTSSARGGPEVNALQEIGGLIQVLGVLSGIQIGGPSSPTIPPHHPHTPSFPPNPSAAWVPPGVPPSSAPLTHDIGTAVYPCLVLACQKTFSRLYSLRAHQRVHSVERPFRCDQCPASFARNHDLKRHSKLHEKIAWKCAGCDKIFSRRDAIKRHKNSSRTRGKGEACVEAAVLEVQVDKQSEEDEVREGRRARIWNGIAAHQYATPAFASIPGAEGSQEEGELHPDILRRSQATVLRLHALLQERVSQSLGAPPGQVVSQPPVDPISGQATLASVIARAQSNAGPFVTPLPPLVTPEKLAPEVNSTQEGMLPTQSAEGSVGSSLPSLSLYGLSDEQTRMIEQAIASAASAAQLQAEAEAAMEEEEEEDLEEVDDDELDDDEDVKSQK